MNELVNRKAFLRLKLSELGVEKPMPLSTILICVEEKRFRRLQPHDVHYLAGLFKSVLPNGTPLTDWYWVAMMPLQDSKGQSIIFRVDTDAYGNFSLREYWAPLWFEFGPECEFVVIPT